MSNRIAPLLAIWMYVFCSAFADSVETFQGSSKSNATATAVEIAGVWRGTSDCVVANSPCHDEINVYRFTEVASKPGTFQGSAAKLVDGKEVVMGSSDWIYDSANHTLETRLLNGSTVHFVVGTAKMEGSLLLSDKSTYRRIQLKKDR